MKKEDLIKAEEEEHKKFHRRLIYVFMIIMFILFGGATFYHFNEGWRYLDALYFSAYTMTTVGYGDFVPKTDAGKMFTIVYMFTGVGIALYGLSLLSSHFVEVREEYWLQQIGKIKFKQHTETFWGKIKNALNFSPQQLSEDYEEKDNATAKRKK